MSDEVEQKKDGTRSQGASATIVALALVALLRLVLVAPFPMGFKDLRVDDALYLKLAHHISEGEWLGPYDEMTLMKDLGYPLFIAASHKLGVPLRISQELVWLFANFCFFALLRRLGVGWFMAFLAMAFILFHPGATPGNYGRIIREHIYNGQILGFVSLGLILALTRGLRGRALLGVPYALLAVWTWHTREEGIWLAPIIFAHIAVMLWFDRKERRTKHGLAVGAVLLALIAGGLFAYRTVVTDLNEEHYGAPVFIESKDEDFRAALGAIIRAEQKDEERFYPIYDGTLAELYSVSPALRELRGTMDSHAYRGGWMGETKGSRATNGTGFVLRGAAMLRGHHRSLPESKAFYKQLASEVNSHLNKDQERYGKERVSVFPPMRLHWWDTVLERTGESIKDCWQLNMTNVGTTPVPATDDVAFKVAERSRILVGQDAVPAQLVVADRRNVLEKLLEIYRLILPFLGIIGVVWLLVEFIGFRRVQPAAFGALVFAAVALMRCLMVGALEVWFCPSLSTYLICAYPIFAAFGLIAIGRTLSEFVGCRMPRRLDSAAARVLLALVFIGGAWWLGNKVAAEGPYAEVPTALASRISPNEVLVMEPKGLRLVGAREGLAFEAVRSEQGLHVTPHLIQQRPRPVDFVLKGRLRGALRPRINVAIWMTPNDGTQPFHDFVEVAEDGAFEKRFPIKATRVAVIYLDVAFGPQGRLEIDDLRLEPTP